MAPNISEEIGLESSEENLEKLVAPQAGPRKYELIYSVTMSLIYVHSASAYALYLGWTRAYWSTILFTYVLYVLAQIGVCAGAHRLWSHRSFKATTPLQILLMVMHSLSYQYTAYNWARDHRLHHRYADTDADPHNSTRGFFYCHVGWLIVKKHPEVARRGKFVDFSDLNTNAVLQFQKRYAIPFIGLVGFVLPTIIPVYFWGESFNVAWHFCFLRYACNLHATFTINSLAHLWGYKPYDKNIQPTQNEIVSVVALGEGFHNYHHTYPWDYRAAELGNNVLNWTTLFIDLFAKIGWAYDLKTVPKEVVMKRAERTGDGTDLWGSKRLSKTEL
ncbi:unnamed protein product [Pieris macdunnoughi]|uniref:Fatty acid desaturase domain-containing protein n=1 Tax=Pieris macdunnoughi TaxID=345717 RepID=A0A821XB40_9NEOP|nr:unnamed protein product [Pieris macdunnoughi]